MSNPTSGIDFTGLLLDQQMNLQAMAYDVTEPADRRRSCANLSELFFQIVRVVEPDLFIEAGAKEASSSVLASRLLSEARVIAFEANPYTFDRFRQRISKSSRVEYLNLALSNVAGEVTFKVNVEPDGTPRADGRGSLMSFEGEQESFAGTVDVTVESTTLDGFLSDHEYESCALWIDVEGASELVLSGSNSTIDRASVVIIEVEDRAYWDGQWLRTDVVGFMLSHGLVPIARDFQSRYLYNIVFARQSTLDVDRVRWALVNHLSRSASGSASRTGHGLHRLGPEQSGTRWASSTEFEWPGPSSPSYAAARQTVYDALPSTADQLHARGTGWRGRAHSE